MQELLKSASIPKHLVWILPVVCFLLSSIHAPYVIDADTAISMKIAQQFSLQHDHPFHSLVGADPQDLSKDTSTWLNWYSPGVSLFFALPYWLNLPLGWTAKILSLLYFIFGAWGMWKIVVRYSPHPLTQWVFSLTLPATYVNWLGGSHLSGDVLPFAAAPWLVLLTLHWREKVHAFGAPYLTLAANALLLGLFSGSIYWLKLSGWLITVSFHMAASLVLLFEASACPRSKRFALATILGVGNIVPVILLSVLNVYYSGQWSPTGDLQEFALDCPSVHGIFLLLSICGALGLWIFHVGVPLYHVLFFMEDKIPGVDILGDHYYRVVHLGWMGLPFSILCIAALYWWFKKNKNTFPLIVILSLCFSSLLLGYSSNKGGFNCLTLAGSRYITPIFAWVNAYVFYIAWQFIGQRIKCIPNVFRGFLITLAVVPTLFIYMVFTKQQLIDKSKLHYSSTRNALYFRYIPDIKSVQETVNSLATSPMDVIAVAHTGGGYFGSWLEFTQRLLPLVDTWGHLQRTYGLGGSVFADTEFTTTQPLRMILILTSEFANSPGARDKLLARFPQADKWMMKDVQGTQIWYADLVPSS